MKPAWIAVLLIFEFALGITVGYFFTDYFTLEQPQPSSFLSSPERVSPYDFVREDQIKLSPHKVEILFPDHTLGWARYTDSNSMDPTLDIGTNGIEIIPEKPEDIHVGNIIAYKYYDDILVHRVIETGYDTNGWYAVTKGDNNAFPDTRKIRFANVVGMTVALIY